MREAIDQHAPAVKHGLDTLAALGVIGTLAGYLPVIAAFLGCVWYCLQIIGWFREQRARKRSYRRRKTDA